MSLQHAYKFNNRLVLRTIRNHACEQYFMKKPIYLARQVDNMHECFDYEMVLTDCHSSIENGRMCG